MSRVGEGWNGKIDEFRKINHDLKNSLSKLKDDNGLLKLQVCDLYYISVLLLYLYILLTG